MTARGVPPAPPHFLSIFCQIVDKFFVEIIFLGGGTLVVRDPNSPPPPPTGSGTRSDTRKKLFGTPLPPPPPPPLEVTPKKKIWDPPRTPELQNSGPPCEQIEKVKTLPSLKLRLRAVKIAKQVVLTGYCYVRTLVFWKYRRCQRANYGAICWQIWELWVILSLLEV